MDNYVSIDTVDIMENIIALESYLEFEDTIEKMNEKEQELVLRPITAGNESVKETVNKMIKTVVENVKKLWKAIKQLIKKIIDWVRGLFGKNKKKNIDIAKEVEKQMEEETAKYLENKKEIVVKLDKVKEEQKENDEELKAIEFNLAKSFLIMYTDKAIDLINSGKLKLKKDIEMKIKKELFSIAFTDKEISPKRFLEFTAAQGIFIKQLDVVLEYEGIRIIDKSKGTGLDLVLAASPVRLKKTSLDDAIIKVIQRHYKSAFVVDTDSFTRHRLKFRIADMKSAGHVSFAIDKAKKYNKVKISDIEKNPEKYKAIEDLINKAKKCKTEFLTLDGDSKIPGFNLSKTKLILPKLSDMTEIATTMDKVKALAKDMTDKLDKLLKETDKAIEDYTKSNQNPILLNALKVFIKKYRFINQGYLSTLADSNKTIEDYLYFRTVLHLSPNYFENEPLEIAEMLKPE